MAFPILGSGVGGFDFRRAAEVMRDAVRVAADAAALEEIVFYGYAPQDAEILREVIADR